MADKFVLKKLTVKEVICPICREIFIEPVSLPCKHIVCLQCLEQTVENNTLSCPICRTWIGTFLRLAKNRNKIINHKLWEQLKKQFPREIERKCNGEEDGISDQLMEDQPRPSLTTDRCSIKKEFDDLLNKLKIEEEKCRKAEQSASEKLAQQLMEEELKAERIRKIEDSNISIQDSILARSMVESESENWEPDDMQADSTSNGDDKDVENGRDSISIEFRHFTPICIVPKTPPKLLPNGQVKDTKILKPKNLSRSLDRRRTNKSGLSLQNKASLKVSSNNFLSIQALMSATGPADTTTNDDLLPSPCPTDESDDKISQDILDEQRRIEKRILQEKADYSLAVKLQRRWGRTPVKRAHPYSLRSAKKTRDDSS
ncbi:hypothetical protein GE061_018609 [Apolygus lucorum]|uniref:RING-type E3 ubiquitin transferase n=1 Tax=Apolygus lucorum TaxID=248454 RepID=A0A6A4JAJ2_APOLU|nr:hypothetical protein GE061_018609 [Apolygus lucorum]